MRKIVIFSSALLTITLLLANISAIGIVLSRILQGTLTSIIFFLLWITFSFIILLWGAELAAVLNERIDEKAA